MAFSHLYKIKSDDKNAQVIMGVLTAFKNCADYSDIDCFCIDGCSFFNGYVTKRVHIDAIPKESFKNKDFVEFAIEVESKLASLGFDAIISVCYDDEYSGAVLSLR